MRLLDVGNIDIIMIINNKFSRFIVNHDAPDGSNFDLKKSPR